MRADRGVVTSRLGFAAVLVSTVVTISAGVALAAVDPEAESRNFAKTEERNRYIVKTPEFQARLQQQHVQDNADLAQIAAEEAALGDEARNFSGNVCFQRKQECAGDVRYYDWEASGFGISQPLRYTARNGATISGKVWATEAGPAKRPAIVITTGSVQAPETLYWPFAAVLAKHGYVVLTYDVQGQGRSDTFGAAPDEQEGFPSQAGQPFYDGTEDALDFILSNAERALRPTAELRQRQRRHWHRPLRQAQAPRRRRPRRRLQPLLGPGRSRARSGSPATRSAPAPSPTSARSTTGSTRSSPGTTSATGWRRNHPDVPPAPGHGPTTRRSPSRRSACRTTTAWSQRRTDPGASRPDPEGSNGGFAAFKAAGVDSMQVNRRGGTHYEYSFIPGETAHPLGLATYRGMDMAVWYTTAWFDRYVKCQGDSACQAEADQRLLTNRWRNDQAEGSGRPAADPNLYSFYKLSRFDLTDASGAERTCDDMRTGCGTMTADPLEPPATSRSPMPTGSIRSTVVGVAAVAATRTHLPAASPRRAPTPTTARRPCPTPTAATRSAPAVATTRSAAVPVPTASLAAAATTSSRASRTPMRCAGAGAPTA